MDNLPNELIHEIISHLDYFNICSLYKTHKMFHILNNKEHEKYIDMIRGDNKIFISSSLECANIFIIKVYKGYNSNGPTYCEYIKTISTDIITIMKNYDEMVINLKKVILNYDYNDYDISYKLLYGNKLLRYTKYFYSSHKMEEKKYDVSLTNNTTFKNINICDMTFYELRIEYPYDTRMLGLYDNYEKALNEYIDRVKNVKYHDIEISINKLTVKNEYELDSKEIINPKSYWTDYTH